MLRRPPRSTPFPTRRSSDLTGVHVQIADAPADAAAVKHANAKPQQRSLVRSAVALLVQSPQLASAIEDRKSTRLNSSHQIISYAVFCLKKKIAPVTRPACLI